MKKSLTITASLCCIAVFATTWKVGPSRTYTVPSSVTALVQTGDTVEIDATTYLGDVARWTTNNLVLKGFGGIAVLDANQTAYGRKGIWVLSCNNVTVENIEFANCHDVSGNDANWAGIRMEGSGLIVRNCYFHDNDDGILEGGITSSDIVIEYTEFNHNGWGDGYSHNLYIGHCKSLTFSHNYSHHAHIGHEFKSRATTNYILYNRIGNEVSGDASREIDLPNGGISILMGNTIQQGPNTDNSNIIGYGLEGLTTGETHEMYLINNTIVNTRSGGIFVQINSGTGKYKTYNTIFAGSATLLSGTATVLDTSHNWIVSNPANVGFVNPTNFDYHLLPTSKAINNGTAAGSSTGGFVLTPSFEYVHPKNRVARTSAGVIDIGAFEFNNATGLTTVSQKAQAEFYVYADAYDNTVNMFFTNLQADKDIFIYDVTGKLQLKYEKAASSKITFNKSTFAPGIYIAEMKTGEVVMSKKFIVN